MLFFALCPSSLSAPAPHSTIVFACLARSRPCEPPPTVLFLFSCSVLPFVRQASLCPRPTLRLFPHASLDHAPVSHRPPYSFLFPCFPLPFVRRASVHPRPTLLLFSHAVADQASVRSVNLPLVARAPPCAPSIISSALPTARLQVWLRFGRLPHPRPSPQALPLPSRDPRSRRVVRSRPARCHPRSPRSRASARRPACRPSPGPGGG
jgi:hypothetical protein